MSETPTEPRPADAGGRRSLLFLLPLAAFVALAAVFLIRLEAGGDPEAIPSALIGKPAPQFDLPSLDGMQGPSGPLPGLKTADFAGKVTVLNIFASWCAPCEVEAPVLMDLKSKGVKLVGVAYKDAPDNTKAFLGRVGDPYVKRLTDRDGRAGIELGVTGVPETYLVDGDGMILAKYPAPLSQADAKALLARIAASR